VLGKTIKRLLFGPLPVAAALLLGGVVMIAVERWRKARGVEGVSGTEQVTLRRALIIGLGQCFALWPGMSRSMSTIVAGQLAGLSTATAAEFSFLLSVPTLGAATLYEIYKARADLAQGIGAAQLAAGLLVSFGVAWLVIAGFVRYLGKRGLEPFGYYRIALAVLVVVLAST
jgi:undecaprenyl-diphosphatase